VSFALGYINQVTLPHSFGRAFRLICAIALETGYDFDELKAVKEAIANPGASAPAAAGPEKKAAVAAKEPEPEPEEETAPAVDLFGGGAKGGGDY